MIAAPGSKTTHQKSLALFREIATKVKTQGGTEPKKFGETRYGSRVMMGDRMLKTRPIYEQLLVAPPFTEWLSKQNRDVRSKVRAFPPSHLC